MKKQHDMQVQSLSFLVDVELSCSDVLEQRLSCFVEEFAQMMPSKFEDWDEEQIRATVWANHVDSYGQIGSRLLWDALGVLEAPSDFCERARQQISEVTAGDRAALENEDVNTNKRKKMEQSESRVDGGAIHEERIGFIDEEMSKCHEGKKVSVKGGTRKHHQVFAYAEYDLEPPPGEQEEIKGRMLFENGFRTVRAQERWLKPTPLPISTWVDRSLCAEAQMMQTFCTQLKLEGLGDLGNTALNELLHGSLYVYTSKPPCISCVGTLWQFQLLFKNVKLRFTSASGRGLASMRL